MLFFVHIFNILKRDMLQEEWKMNAIFFEDGCGDVSLGGIQFGDALI